MVQQADAEFATGNLDEYTRYFNYLRTLADLTAMASIIAVQVIGCFEIWKCSPCKFESERNGENDSIRSRDED